MNDTSLVRTVLLDYINSLESQIEGLKYTYKTATYDGKRQACKRSLAILRPKLRKARNAIKLLY